MQQTLQRRSSNEDNIIDFCNVLMKSIAKKGTSIYKCFIIVMAIFVCRRQSVNKNRRTHVLNNFLGFNFFCKIQFGAVFLYVHNLFTILSNLLNAD